LAKVRMRSTSPPPQRRSILTFLFPIQPSLSSSFLKVPEASLSVRIGFCGIHQHTQPANAISRLRQQVEGLAQQDATNQSAEFPPPHSITSSV
jgi:hypothetical protein